MHTGPAHGASASTSPDGVILFNLGGPETLADVEPFLVRLFSDREIIELPVGAALQPLVARVIAKVRGPSVRRNYAMIGGGSPQLRITRAQAAVLEARLNRSGLRAVRVAMAMRYARPGAEDALGELAAAGVRRIVTLSLFPHWSKATTGSSAAAFARALAQPRWRDCRFDVRSVDAYPDHPLYLDAMAGTVRRALDTFAPAVRDRVVILFSAHGLPRKFIEQGDPYVEHIRCTRDGVFSRLGVDNRHVLAYQSRTGPVKWIGPGTDEQIERLGGEGVRHLLVVPLSFVSDHIETSYEIDILFARLARRAGILEYRRSPALNTDPVFIEALAQLVEPHLQADRADDAHPPLRPIAARRETTGAPACGAA